MGAEPEISHWCLMPLRGNGFEYDLPVGRTTVGRDVTCDVKICIPIVSRKHCIITVSQFDQVELVDWVSNFFDKFSIKIGTEKEN